MMAIGACAGSKDPGDLGRALAVAVASPLTVVPIVAGQRLSSPWPFRGRPGSFAGAAKHSCARLARMSLASRGVPLLSATRPLLRSQFHCLGWSRNRRVSDGPRQRLSPGCPVPPPLGSCVPPGGWPAPLPFVRAGEQDYCPGTSADQFAARRTFGRLRESGRKTAAGPRGELPVPPRRAPSNIGKGFWALGWLAGESRRQQTPGSKEQLQ
jgi:hypothetical protein